MPRSEEQKARDKETRRERQALAYRDARAAILDTFSSARHFKLTHRQILDRLAARRAMPRWSRLTQYDRAKLSGFEDALWHCVETQCLDWRLTLPDGTWIDAKEYPYSEIDCTSYRMLGNHFWRGTDAPYGEPGPMHSKDQ